MTDRDETSLAPVFVVSTGRCGSTLLSAMLRLHPQILSVSEFFAYLGPGGVRAPRVSGEAAFRRLNTPTRALRAFLDSASIGEFLYPLDSGGATVLAISLRSCARRSLTSRTRTRSCGTSWVRRSGRGVGTG